jgi:hypothetical protein
MRDTSGRHLRLPRVWAWLIAALVVVTCLTLGQPGAVSTVQQGRLPDAQVALAAALHDVDGDSSGPGKNIVTAVGTNDLRLTFRGHAQVDAYESTTVSTKNVAIALGSCYQCLNFAVALQLVLVSPAASNITTTAKSFAVNVDCQNCTTVSVSIVYVIITPHPEQAAKHVQDAIDHINDQFDAMSEWSRRPLATVAARINGAISQFATAAISAALGSIASPKGAAPNTAAPRVGTNTSGTVLPGGIQLVPALPGTPRVDVEQGQ